MCIETVLSVESSLPFFFVKITDLYFVVVRLDAVETFLLVLLLIQTSLIPMNLTFTSAVMLEYRLVPPHTHTPLLKHVCVTESQNSHFRKFFFYVTFLLHRKDTRIFRILIV